jgi:hypothetical protein
MVFFYMLVETDIPATGLMTNVTDLVFLKLMGMFTILFAPALPFLFIAHYSFAQSAHSLIFMQNSI